MRLPALQSLHRLLALTFARKTSRLAPVERKFLRKYLGFSSASFAQTIGVADETVLAWESGEKSMPVKTEVWLRLTVAMRKRLESYDSTTPRTGTTPRRPPTFEVHASA
ncbi:MAG: hypothetical protein IPK71_03155 [Myxococcales bacterium]|nr:hypothetical protein [Myxococcales bacterium]